MTEAASTAIEALLDRELHVPEPSEEACADTMRPSAAATPWANVRSCATCCLPSRRAWM
jgi:hypothetical protein